MNKQKAVLFIPLGIYAFEQQLATALYLASQSDFRPYFLLISEGDHEFIDQLDAAAIPYSTLDPVRGGGEGPVSALSHNNQNRLKPRARSLLNGFRWWRQLWHRKRVSKRIVQALAPHCAVVSQERVVEFLPTLKALRELIVPIILMPAAVGAPDGPAHQRRESYLLKIGLKDPLASRENSPYPPLVRRQPVWLVPGTVFLNRWVQRWLPSQVYDSRWGKMLFYPAAQILMLRAMGMLPRNPWYQGSTFADYIMISGTDESAMYAEARVEPDKLLYYGSYELDVLYERWLRRGEVRQMLINGYHLDPGYRVMMVSLPPLWEQNVTSEEVHWQSINEILDVLSHTDYNVVILLHPSADRNHYVWIEEKYPVKICREPLKDVVVSADIFVAAYSSTIRWAIGLGIPVINLDFWGLNYEWLRNLNGYQTVTTISEFNESVGSFAAATNNEGFSSGPSSVSPWAAQIVSEFEGPGQDVRGVLVDGRAKERLLGFIQSLSQGGQPSVASNRLPASTGMSKS